MVGQDRTGDFILQTLLSDSLCKKNTPPADSNYLIDSPFGIYVSRNGTIDSTGYRGEGHYGQLLKILAESGVPVLTPASTASGHTGTVRHLLQDAIMRYSPSLEQEFITIALALYLPPAATSWTDQYGNKYTFDDLAEALLRMDHGQGPCGGCHVPYALVVLLRVNDMHPILSLRVRDKTLRWLADLSRVLEESQRSTGGWDLAWPLLAKIDEAFRDPCLDRITMTGHHLEWIALAPASVRPSAKTLLPCSHAARALCLLKGVQAYPSWYSFASKGQLQRTSKGYCMRTN